MNSVARAPYYIRAVEDFLHDTIQLRYAFYPWTLFLDGTQSVVIAVVIMVVVIPIVIRTPAMLVFIPPSMIRVPAVLPGFVQHVAPMFRLLTMIAVVLYGFVQIVIGFRNASLAVVIGAQARSVYKYKKSG